MNDKKSSPPLDADLLEAFAAASAPMTPDEQTTGRMREKLFQRIHAPAPDYLFVHSHEGEWVTLLRGVELKLLRQDEISRSFLIRMKPGSRLPPHEHALEEESLVLEGDATINGVLCLPGDYHLAPKGKPHGWVTSEKGCLLFVRGAAEQRTRP
ncbi:MAG: cupin domain-containing protein [Hydrogenophilaceae bacterium]|nr:cupin domain-containing protein [Hydrogenophilaceae bacterium]